MSSLYSAFFSFVCLADRHYYFGNFWPHTHRLASADHPRDLDRLISL